MNEKNLIPLNTLSESERKAIARKGGKASGKARKELSNFKKVVKTLLSAEFYDKEAKKTLTGYEAVAIQMFRKALQGDRQSAEFLRDTAGESPKEKKQEQQEQQNRKIIFTIVRAKDTQGNLEKEQETKKLEFVK